MTKFRNQWRNPMNIEALKSNPLFAKSVAKQIEIQKSADSTIDETAQTSQYSGKSANGSDFVQRIKGTNEAAGFISTASKGIEALKLATQSGDAQNILDTASKISFNGKGILDPQAFDTTAGIVTVDLGLNLQNIDLHTAQGKEELQKRLDSASVKLQDAKKSLAAPINKAEKEQSAKLQSMNTSNSEFLTRFHDAMDRQNSIVDTVATETPKGLAALEATMNKIGNQIF